MYNIREKKRKIFEAVAQFEIGNFTKSHSGRKAITDLKFHRKENWLRQKTAEE